MEESMNLAKEFGQSHLTKFDPTFPLCNCNHYRKMEQGQFSQYSFIRYSHALDCNISLAEPVLHLILPIFGSSFSQCCRRIRWAPQSPYSVGKFGAHTHYSAQALKPLGECFFTFLLFS